MRKERGCFAQRGAVGVVDALGFEMPLLGVIMGIDRRMSLLFKRPIVFQGAKCFYSQTTGWFINCEVLCKL